MTEDAKTKEKAVFKRIHNLWIVADGLFLDGKYEDAIGEYKSIIELTESGDAFVRMAECYLRLKNVDAALKALANARKEFQKCIEIVDENEKELQKTKVSASSPNLGPKKKNK